MAFLHMNPENASNFNIEEDNDRCLVKATLSAALSYSHRNDVLGSMREARRAGI
jgi:hypothetical protein